MRGLAAAPEVPSGIGLAPAMDKAAYASPINVLVSAIVLLTVLAVARWGRGFIANISVLVGIFVGGVVAALLGMMHFDKVADAEWFALITPLRFGMPIFEPIAILAMTLVMIVVMIESTGMFLALGEMCNRRIERKALTAGLRTDGLGPGDLQESGSPFRLQGPAWTTP